MPARILIIEDNPANLELMNYLLLAFGHNTLTACDGDEGLDVVQRESPDLIICDVELPGINGLEIARRLKSDLDLRWIPLVAVTAFAMVGDSERILTAGFDGYIPKPIAPETFVQQVESFLPIIEISTPTNLPRPTMQTSHPERRLRSILVVDNLPINLELMRSLLEPSGYYVFSSRNVDDGLEMARQTIVDLIISDVHMPEKDGYAFIQAVKGDPRLRDIPFMFISSTLERGHDAERSIAAGADRFIVRPIEPQTLLAEIESLIKK
jgi:CheY-like chemotaxis protein